MYDPKDKIKRYEIVVYLFLLSIGVVLSFISEKIDQQTIKSILVNLASDLFGIGIVFFILNRLFLLGDNEKYSDNLLEEIKSINSFLHQDYEQRLRLQQQKISVILQNGGRNRLELPIELRRAELTRAEVLGRIGMIPMKSKGQRFTLNYLSTREFLIQINQILEGNGDSILTIPCSEIEFQQFDLNG